MSTQNQTSMYKPHQELKVVIVKRVQEVDA